MLKACGRPHVWSVHRSLPLAWKLANSKPTSLDSSRPGLAFQSRYLTVSYSPVLSACTMSIASMFTKAAGKRSREWEEESDPEELKLVIEAKDAEIEKLLKENKELKKQIKSSAGSPAARSPEDLQKQAETLMKAIVKNIEGQMIYKKGMKDKSKRAAADFPGTDLEVVMAMLGSDNCKAASNGSKQFTAKVSKVWELPGVSGGALRKSLRYGNTLELTDGLKFAYDKGERQLRVTGAFKMI